MFGFVQRVLRMAAEQQKHASLIERQASQLEEQAAQLADLRNQIPILQLREAELLAKVQTEALKAAGASTTELARRVVFLEGRASRD